MKKQAYVVVAVIIVLGLGPSDCGAGEPGRLYAGTAKVDITPPAGHFDGTRTITAEMIHDPLLARVVMLSDGRVSLAIVSLDLLLFSSKRVVTEAKRKWNVDHVILSSVHTHSGMNPRTGGTPMHPKGMLDAAWTRKGDPGEVLDPRDRWLPADVPGAPSPC